MRWAELLNRVASGWSTWAVAGVVEATLLLGIVAVVLLAAGKRLPAAAAHLALLVVLVKAVLPIGIPVPRPELPEWFARTTERAELKDDTRAMSATAVPSAPAAPALSSAAVVQSESQTSGARPRETVAARGEQSAVNSAETTELSWQAHAMLLWVSVSAAIAVRSVLGQLRLRQAADCAASSADAALQSTVQVLATRLGIRRGIKVVMGPDGISPAIAGCWRPTLIVPRSLTARLSEGQLEWVLLHEMAHVRRGDLYCLVLERLVACVAWFNPAVWLASRWAEHYRECACDELALGHASCSRGECGEAFLTLLAGVSNGPRLAMEFLSRGRLAKKRMVRLLDAQPQKVAYKVLATVSALGCVLVFGFVSFHTQPTTAAAQPDRAESRVEPLNAAAAPLTGDAATEAHVRRIREQQNAPMKSGRVRLKVLQLSSLQKDPVQQGHELADRSKTEVEALLDGLDLTDASCFRRIRDGLLAGNLILDHPSYRSLALVWNERGRRATWGNGETTVIKEACNFEYDPSERNASITDGRWFFAASPADWARQLLTVPLRSTILGDLPANRTAPSIERTAEGTTRVIFKQGPRSSSGIEVSWLLGPDGTLLHATELYGFSTVLREIDFREYPGGVHLPRARVRTYYPTLRSGKEEVSGPLQSLTISIIEHAEFNVDIPDSEFRMSVPANTAVWDRRGPLKLRAAEVPTEDVLTLFER